MRSIRYAAYGSNLHPLRLARRIPSSTFLGKSFVPGWSLHFHKQSIDGSGKCNIRNPGDGIYVAVYEFTEEGRDVLDGIEGLGRGYDHHTIDVPDFGPCYTYVASETHVSDELVAYDWYKQLVLSGCRRHYLPETYISRIRKIGVQADPDEERSRREWELVEYLRRNISNKEKSI